MKAGLAIIAACIALGGCGEPGPRGSNVTAESGPDPIEQKIAALPPALQRVTFFRAIQDAGYACQKIDQVQSRGKIGGQPFWTVSCDDGTQYGIALQRGGVFQVSGVPKPGQ